MAMASIGRWLVLAPAVVLLAACAPTAATGPAPQSPTSSETSSADAGHPAVPLTGKGVIVPSDVSMDPSPKRTGQPGADVPSAATAPQMN
jgi:hypothetical protein